jgi:hypothetical protein
MKRRELMNAWADWLEGDEGATRARSGSKQCSSAACGQSPSAGLRFSSRRIAARKGEDVSNTILRFARAERD